MKRERRKKHRQAEPEEAASKIQRGTVKWFNARTGYGFIGRGDGKPDLYVHFTGIVGDGFRSLNAGDHVEFETQPGLQSGQVQASQVRVVPDATKL